jgi:hypothetical protein
MTVTGFSDANLASNHIDRRSKSGYCMFIGGNLVTWRSKKHNVVAHSSVEAKYCAITHTACEMLWVHTLLHDVGVGVPSPMQMNCDNQTAYC